MWYGGATASTNSDTNTNDGQSGILFPASSSSSAFAWDLSYTYMDSSSSYTNNDYKSATVW